MKSLSSRLELILKYREVSQAQLARALHTSRSSVSNWINNDSVPGSYLPKLAAELNVSLDWLVMGKGPMNLNGLQYVSEEDYRFICSLRRLQPDLLSAIVDFLYEYLKPIYGENAFEVIALEQMILDAQLPWLCCTLEGDLIDTNIPLLKLFEKDEHEVEEIIGENILSWASDPSGDSLFLRFKEHMIKNPDSTPFSCKLIVNQNILKTVKVYYSFEGKGCDIFNAVVIECN